MHVSWIYGETGRDKDRSDNILARYILVSIQETRMIWSYIPIERTEIINTRRVIRVKI